MRPLVVASAPCAPHAAGTEALLGGLNPAQRAAVAHPGGPALVVAGPGAGKTRVLTYRLAYLLESRVAEPSNLLAVTFTNKAAREMRERVAGLVGERAGALWVSTFHSACLRILRAHAPVLGLKSHFAVAAEDDSLAAVKRVLRPDDAVIGTPRVIRSRISAAKSAMRSPGDVARHIDSDLDERFVEIYRAYEGELKRLHALDFDDLLVVCVRLFREHPDVLESYHDRITHLLVDEYQDTNTPQSALVEAFGRRTREVFAVGDPAQAIYGFRGADLGNILAFQKRYPEARVYEVGINYRSTQNILDAASSLLDAAPGRMRVALVAHTADAGSVTTQHYSASEVEAEAVATEVARLRRAGVASSEIAVLYRVNALSRAIESAFLRHEIPYQVVGGLRFFDRREIKDVLAWVRLAVRRDDVLAFSRAVGVPKRGIGAKGADAVISASLDFDGDIVATCRDRARAGGRGCEALLGVADTADELAAILSGDGNLGERLRRSVEALGYESHLEAICEDEDEVELRMENLAELGAMATHYSDVGAFLDGVDLLDSLDEDAGEDRVWCSTIHAAKGLEWRCVFVVGVEEGICPHSKAIESGDVEEERRLLYVAMTRARRRLALSWCEQRTMWGTTRSAEASRFLEEL